MIRYLQVKILASWVTLPVIILVLWFGHTIPGLIMACVLGVLRFTKPKIPQMRGWIDITVIAVLIGMLGLIALDSFVAPPEATWDILRPLFFVLALIVLAKMAYIDWHTFRSAKAQPGEGGNGEHHGAKDAS